MKHILTLSDKKYLPFALTMYESLKRYSTDFKLHYLATDDETYKWLKERELEDVVVYRLDNLPQEDLAKATENCPMVDAEGQSQFHFALAPIFCNYAINHLWLDNALYADADIFWYRDVQEVYDSAKHFSIGLVTHKHQAFEWNCKTGYFNVGIVYFDTLPNIDAFLCTEFWKEATISKDHYWYKNYGTCGDQKYLELFPMMFGGTVKVLDTDIGHGAPWNFSRSTIKDGNITWNSEFVLKKGDVTQPLVFNHFSHFHPIIQRIDQKEMLIDYRVDHAGEWGNILPNEGIREAYDDYYKNMVEAKSKYKV